MYRVGSFSTALELELDLVGIQKVSWDRGGKERAGFIFSSMEKKPKSISWEQDILYTTEVSAIRK